MVEGDPFAIISRVLAAVSLLTDVLLGATARLVAASKAKADPTSPTAGKLEVAAKTVAAATAKLVEAAKLAMQEQQEAKERGILLFLFLTNWTKTHIHKHLF